MGDTIWVIIALVVGLGMLFLAVYIPYRIIKAIIKLVKKSNEELKENNIKRWAPVDYTKVPNLETDVKHINGLPIAEDAACVIKRFSDRYEFHAGGATFDLAISKITDISVRTDIEIQKQYVSSIGGAVGGAVLFGPLGAMIGGRAKEKKSTTMSKYLIFTYLNDEELKYIGFDCTAQYWLGNKIEKDFKKNKPAENNVKISL